MPCTPAWELCRDWWVAGALRVDVCSQRQLQLGFPVTGSKMTRMELEALVHTRRRRDAQVEKEKKVS